MPAITSAQTGLWSATSTWVGGVVPNEFDTVTIAVGHTVTVNGTFIVGNDSTTGLTINGRLKASRTANSLLTIKGNIANATTGEWDWGVEGDIIPASVTAGIRINYSGTMANSKYDLRLGATNRMNLIAMRGVDKVRHTKTTTAVTGGTTTTFTVTDATGWAVGDWLIASADVSTNTTTLVEGRQISALSGNDVTVSPAWTYSRNAGAVVANVWSNVYIEHFSATNIAGFLITPRNGMPANSVDIKNVSTHGCSTDSSTSGFSIHLAPYFANSTAVFRDGVIARCAASNIRRDGTAQTAAGTGIGFGFSACLLETEYVECVVAVRTAALSTAFRAASLSAGSGFRNCCAVNVATVYLSNFSDGGQGITITDLTVRNAAQVATMTPGNSLIFNGGDFDCYNRFTSIASGDITVNGANFGTNHAGVITNTGVALGLMKCTINNSTVGSMALSTAVFTTLPANPLAEFSFVNKNSDPTQQEIQNARGFIARDNVVDKRSTSSIRFQPQRAGVAHNRIYALPGASAGQTVMVRGALRFDATYGTATPPSVTLSGQGSTPVTFTAPATADAWHDFVLTATLASTGDMTLTVTGTSTATTGNYYLDGVIIPPFVVVARHYGYLYNNAVFQTVDPIISVSNEVTVAAYTGIAVDHATDTITLTTNRTIAELYDYLKYNLGLTANLFEPDYVSGTLASLSIGAYSLIIDGCTLDSGGTLTTTGLITLVNGAVFVGTRTDANGTVIPPKTVSITGLTAGSRLRIYNTTTATEVVNQIIAGTSYNTTYNEGTNYTTGDALTITATWQSGATAKLPFSTQVVVGSSGWSALINQQADTVYAGIGVDGSTVTEFTPDYPNVQVDINDSNGQTSIDRLYAWFVATTTTESGIRNWFGGIVAEDAANFRVVTAILNLKLDNLSATGVEFTGGLRLYRDDDASPLVSSTTGGGSITLFAGKVYTAQGGGTTAQQVWEYTTRTLTANPGPTAQQNATAVRTELSTELGRIDIATSTRLSSASYTAPANSDIAAIKAKTDNLPADPASNTQVNTRLATSAYTAPANADIAAIKAKTDNLPTQPASRGEISVVNDGVKKASLLIPHTNNLPV